MKLANTIMRFNKTKRSNKILAVVIVLAVVAIGLVLIITHASTPFGQVTATSGTLAGNASVASNTGATNGKYVQFDGSSTVTPPPGGPPALPTGTQTVNGITFTPMYTTDFKGTTTTPPTNTYWFKSSSPGAGDNAIWTGQGAQISNGLLAITTDEESGQVASGGIGVSSSLAQTPPAMADWTEEFGANVTNLVRYMLWWPEQNINWPADQEFDMLEGNPANPTQFHMTWHGNNPTPSSCNNNCTNVTVGHLPESGIDNVNQWYAFRSIWVAGSNGYLELLAGPSFSSLTEVDEITAAQISSGQGGAQIDSTAHVADWAVEAEGPISSSQITPPIVDNIGGFQLYK